MLCPLVSVDQNRWRETANQNICLDKCNSPLVSSGMNNNIVEALLAFAA